MLNKSDGKQFFVSSGDLRRQTFGEAAHIKIPGFKLQLRNVLRSLSMCNYMCVDTRPSYVSHGKVNSLSSTVLETLYHNSVTIRNSRVSNILSTFMASCEIAAISIQGGYRRLERRSPVPYSPCEADCEIV